MRVFLFNELIKKEIKKEKRIYMREKKIQKNICYASTRYL
jgi:hypothetical protein